MHLRFKGQLETSLWSIWGYQQLLGQVTVMRKVQVAWPEHGPLLRKLWGLLMPETELQVGVVCFCVFCYWNMSMVINFKTSLQDGVLFVSVFCCRNINSLLVGYLFIFCGFKSRQQEFVFGVILVPQNNTIMCKHDII